MRPCMRADVSIESSVISVQCAQQQNLTKLQENSRKIKKTKKKQKENPTLFFYQETSRNLKKFQEVSGNFKKFEEIGHPKRCDTEATMLQRSLPSTATEFRHGVAKVALRLCERLSNEQNTTKIRIPAVSYTHLTLPTILLV